MSEYQPFDLKIAGPNSIIENFLRSYRDSQYADLTKSAPWKTPILGVIGPFVGTEAGQTILRIAIRSSETIAIPTGAWATDADMALGTLGLWASLPNPRIKTASEFRSLFTTEERVALRRADPLLADAELRAMAQGSINLDSPLLVALLALAKNKGVLTAARTESILAGVAVE